MQKPMVVHGFVVVVDYHNLTPFLLSDKVLEGLLSCGFVCACTGGPARIAQNVKGQPVDPD